ncbi:hypothetical protein AAEX28_02960 [Lentisphaerota bacterium WC36G]|nr:hypothetical protein LJT99_05840 [Lentisphaerae bacterium WC36]
MKKVFFVGQVLLLVSLLSSVSYGKNKRNVNTGFSKSFAVYKAEWISTKGVKKLYETPLGHLYKFEKIHVDDFCLPTIKRALDYNSEKNLPTLQFELYKNRKDKEKFKRYIVVDIKLRMFPAIDKEEDPSLHFDFFSTKLGANNSYKNKNFEHFSFLSTNIPTPHFKFPPYSIISNVNLNNIKSIPIMYAKNKTHYCLYAYRPVNVRLIFDTFCKDKSILGKKMFNAKPMEVIEKTYFNSINTNGGVDVYPNFTLFDNSGQFIIRSLGFLLEAPPIYSVGRRFIYKLPQPRQYIELADPVIYTTDEKEDLQLLPVVKTTEYPYESYTLKYKPDETNEQRYKRIRKLDNPDEIYAHALKYLEGLNLVYGAKLMKQLAKNENHALAMLQYGICYLHGYGVKKNIYEACKWFKKAKDFGVQDAFAYFHFTKMLIYNRPFLRETESAFLIKQYNNMTRKDDTATKFSPTYSQQFYHNRLLNPVAKFCHETNNELKLISEVLRFVGFFKNMVYLEFDPIQKTIDINRKSKDGKIINSFVNISMYDKRSFGFTINHLDPNRQTNEKYLNSYIAEAIFKKYKYNKPSYYLLKGHSKINLGLSSSKNFEKAVKDALVDFKLGAKINDNKDCLLEIMHCQARLGELTIEDFTEQTDVKFGDYPLYYLLKFAVKNPEYPGIKEFLTRKNYDARMIWLKRNKTLDKYLIALEGLYVYYHYGFFIHKHHSLKAKHYQKDLDKVFQFLKIAADENIPEAMYLRISLIMQKKYNSIVFNDQSFKVTEILNKLVKQKHKLAIYHQVRLQFEKTFSNKQMLIDLQPLLKMNYAPAWVLASKIYHKMNKGNPKKMPKIINFYRKSAKLGANSANNDLGYIYSNLKGEKYDGKAAEHWKEFVRNDVLKRYYEYYESHDETIEEPKAVLWSALKRCKKQKDIPCSMFLLLPSKKRKFIELLIKYSLETSFNHYYFIDNMTMIDESDPKSEKNIQIFRNELEWRKIKPPKYLEVNEDKLNFENGKKDSDKNEDFF